MGEGWRSVNPTGNQGPTVQKGMKTADGMNHPSFRPRFFFRDHGRHPRKSMSATSGSTSGGSPTRHGSLPESENDRGRREGGLHTARITRRPLTSTPPKGKFLSAARMNPDRTVGSGGAVVLPCTARITRLREKGCATGGRGEWPTGSGSGTSAFWDAKVVGKEPAEGGLPGSLPGP